MIWQSGPSLSLIDTFSPQAAACGGRATLTMSSPTASQVTPACAADTSAVLHLPQQLWLRSTPISRASIVILTALTSGFSAETLKHWLRSKSMPATMAWHGLPAATAAPVMVTTSTSGVGCCTSMLPPPVWSQHSRTGTALAQRGPSLMITLGGSSTVALMVTVLGSAGAAAAAGSLGGQLGAPASAGDAPSARPAAARPATKALMLTDLLIVVKPP